MMSCRNFPQSYSAYLDGLASAAEETALAAHLGTCAVCRRTAAEMRCLRLEVAALDRRRPSAQLEADIVAALHLEARKQSIEKRRRADLLDMWRLRLFSQSVGTVVSLTLFIAMTASVFRPAYRALKLARAAAMMEIESEVSQTMTDEVRFKILLLDLPPPPPIFNPSGAVLGFTESLPEEEIFIATVKVQKDGRASVQSVVEPASDPTAVDRLSNALYRQASFQPARQQPRSSDAVLMFSKINISG